MLLERVTLELPTELLRSARQVAEITGASFDPGHCVYADARLTPAGRPVPATEAR
jgi:hypothetical protein